MLGVDARNAQTYVSGAILENGAQLSEIYSDRVILERKGQRATLYLTGYGGPREAPGEAGQALLMTAPAPKIVQYVPPKTSAVTDFIRYMPEYRDGIVTGIRVYPGARVGFFQKWGLQSGDVLTSVDGALPADPDEFGAWFGRLTEGATLSVRVARSGGDVTMTLDGADIVAADAVRTANAAPAPLPP